MANETKYYESIEQINSVLTLKKISVIRELFGAYAADVQVSHDYVLLRIKTRSSIRTIPEFLNECTEFIIYSSEESIIIDLYYYVNE